MPTTYKREYFAPLCGTPRVKTPRNLQTVEVHGLDEEKISFPTCVFKDGTVDHVKYNIELQKFARAVILKQAAKNNKVLDEKEITEKTEQLKHWIKLQVHGDDRPEYDTAILIFGKNIAKIKEFPPFAPNPRTPDTKAKLIINSETGGLAFVYEADFNITNGEDDDPSPSRDSTQIIRVEPKYDTDGNIVGTQLSQEYTLYDTERNKRFTAEQVFPKTHGPIWYTSLDSLCNASIPLSEQISAQLQFQHIVPDSTAATEAEVIAACRSLLTLEINGLSKEFKKYEEALPSQLALQHVFDENADRIFENQLFALQSDELVPIENKYEDDYVALRNKVKTVLATFTNKESKENESKEDLAKLAQEIKNFCNDERTREYNGTITHSKSLLERAEALDCIVQVIYCLIEKDKLKKLVENSREHLTQLQTIHDQISKNLASKDVASLASQAQSFEQHLKNLTQSLREISATRLAMSKVLYHSKDDGDYRIANSARNLMTAATKLFTDCSLGLRLWDTTNTLPDWSKAKDLSEILEAFELWSKQKRLTYDVLADYYRNNYKNLSPADQINLNDKLTLLLKNTRLPFVHEKSKFGVLEVIADETKAENSSNSFVNDCVTACKLWRNSSPPIWTNTNPQDFPKIMTALSLWDAHGILTKDILIDYYTNNYLKLSPSQRNELNLFIEKKCHVTKESNLEVFAVVANFLWQPTATAPGWLNNPQEAFVALQVWHQQNRLTRQVLLSFLSKFYEHLRTNSDELRNWLSIHGATYGNNKNNLIIDALCMVADEAQIHDSIHADSFKARCIVAAKIWRDNEFPNWAQAQNFSAALNALKLWDEEKVLTHAIVKNFYQNYYTKLDPKYRNELNAWINQCQFYHSYLDQKYEVLAIVADNVWIKTQQGKNLIAAKNVDETVVALETKSYQGTLDATVITPEYYANLSSTNKAKIYPTLKGSIYIQLKKENQKKPLKNQMSSVELESKSNAIRANIVFGKRPLSTRIRTYFSKIWTDFSNAQKIGYVLGSLFTAGIAMLVHAWREAAVVDYPNSEEYQKPPAPPKKSKADLKREDALKGFKLASERGTYSYLLSSKLDSWDGSTPFPEPRIPFGSKTPAAAATQPIILITDAEIQKQGHKFFTKIDTAKDSTEIQNICKEAHAYYEKIGRLDLYALIDNAAKVILPRLNASEAAPSIASLAGNSPDEALKYFVQKIDAAKSAGELKSIGDKANQHFEESDEHYMVSINKAIQARNAVLAELPTRSSSPHSPLPGMVVSTESDSEDENSVTNTSSHAALPVPAA